MADKKFSQFTAGSAITDADEVVGLTDGALPAVADTRWAWSQAASYISSKLGAVTVATSAALNADYTSVGAAVAAGAYNLLAIGNITETASFTVTPGATLFIQMPFPGISWTFTDCNCTFDSARVYVACESWFNLIFAMTSGSRPLFTCSNGFNVQLENAHITNNSTQPNSGIVNSSAIISLIGNDNQYTMPNFSNCGISTSAGNTTFFSVLENLTLSGGGANLDYLLNLTNAKLSNIRTSASSITGTGNNPAVLLQDCITNGLTVSTMSTDAVIQINGGKFNDFESFEGDDINVIVDAGSLRPSAQCSDWFITNANVEINNEGQFNNIFQLDGTYTQTVKAQVTNYTGTYLTLTSSSSQLTNIIAGDASNTSTITGDYNTIVNANFSDDVQITGDFNKVAVTFDGNTPSGTKTITIVSGEGNAVIDCTTEAFVSDNGTNTVLDDNNLFA